MRDSCLHLGNEYNFSMSVPDPLLFDSHQFVKRMTPAGMPLVQAEALAEEQGAIVDTHFATKRDTGEIKHRLDNVEHDVAEIKHRLDNVERDIGELKVGLAMVRAEIKHRLDTVERDIAEIKHRLDNVERDIGELKVGLAMVRAELGMVKWMVSGIGAGMLLLLVQTFWPF